MLLGQAQLRLGRREAALQARARRALGGEAVWDAIDSTCARRPRLLRSDAA
nr:hypothetical protein [Lysobacter enzymogenes]